MLQNLSHNTTVSTADDKDLFRVGVASQGDVSDHFLIPVFFHFEKRAFNAKPEHKFKSDNSRKLISFGALDYSVQYQHVAIGLGLEDEDVLVQRFLDVQDLDDLEGHSLT